MKTSEDIMAVVLYLSIVVIAVASVVQAACQCYVISKLMEGP